MKKIIFNILLILFTVLIAQEKVDFRNADPKYFTPEQQQDYRRWRQDQMRILKSSGLRSEVKSVFIQGNKISSIIYNTGAISNPSVTLNKLDLVWNGLGYGYEFGPLVGSRVPKDSDPTDSVSIIIDGFGGSNGLTADGDFSSNNIVKWGWLPKPGYSAPGQNDVATWGARTTDLRIRPKSWPAGWYNESIGEYIYPSFLGGNSTVPDEEVYYVVDDSTDAEFEYYPFVNDRARRGLGLNLEVRTMQFSNPLAEDIMFLVYAAENDVRSKSLPKVFFGMFGDPHIGGGLAANYNDDYASFIPARAIGIPAFDALLTVDGKLTTPLSRNIVYSWDKDGVSDIVGIPPGYFGYKFLESPNNSADAIDNDDDGIIDESPNNSKGSEIDGINRLLTEGIQDVTKYTTLYGAPKPRWSGDEDGDWNKENDDLGVDGIFGTSDFGEGDGFPSQIFYVDMNGNNRYDTGEPYDSVARSGYAWGGSEPNFGFRDVNESDQIGLRSFWSVRYASVRPKDDLQIYNYISSAMDTAALNLTYPINPDAGDFIFLYGSGPFEMQPGHRERFSIALLLGSDLKDLLLNSETAQLVMEANYRFAQPPAKPRVTAVPGDGRVTLYWDRNSEDSRDPFTGKRDFEGYKIYRSEDFTFKDVFSVTDGNGYPFLGKALYDSKSRRTAQWHRPWTPAERTKYAGGFHPIEYRGRFIKYYMGEPEDTSGLKHQYVDSTVTNGKTYYYAVVSFDHGDDSLKLPPSESQAIIQRDAVTQAFKFDANTVVAVPNAEAKGLVSSKELLEKGLTLTHTKGNSTAKLEFKVLNNLATINGSYNISFVKTKIGTDSVIAYSILRRTPVVETVIGNENLFINLTNKNIVLKSLRVFNGADTMASQISPAVIIVDSANGRFRANAAGILLKEKNYTVAYQYYPVVNSGFNKSEDSNPVFDGIRVFATDDTLQYDNARSLFVPTQSSKITSQVAKATAGTEKRMPIDIRFTFVSGTNDTANGMYITPGDTIGSSNGVNGKRVVLPFKITNGTDTTILRAFAATNTPSATPVKWNFGTQIIILPPPYNVSMMGITLSRMDTTVSISAGTVFTARMRKPFTVADEYEFTSKAVVYDAKLADAQLENVIAVPNPYVITSRFEQPSDRPELRGDRVIQFRHLPRECTIRIYTITGELVQTLRKNDNTNYINWDVLSSESARIGYGLYVYHVETPTGATKIGRIGIIK